MNDEIASRLRRARKANFKRAVDAAESLGVPYQTYIAHENGNRVFDLDAAVLYARRYRVSLDWLLAGQGRGPGGAQIDPPISGDAAILSTLKRIAGFTDNDIDLVYGVIRNALLARRAELGPSESGGPPQPATLPREEVPSR
jgi:DNA-binding XRE family transcriptional regulator